MSANTMVHIGESLAEALSELTKITGRQRTDHVRCALLRYFSEELPKLHYHGKDVSATLAALGLDDQNLAPEWEGLGK